MARQLNSVGSRIKDAREGKQMTQADIAKVLGISRAAVAQWESNTTSPSIQTAQEVSKILETTPQWIAYGISGKPEIIFQAPEGSVSIPEVTFGMKPTDIEKGRTWNVPADYLRAELNCSSSTSLVIWRVESPSMAPLFEYGDKVIVDLAAKRPTPSGTFLIWDGVGPSLNLVSVVPTGTGGKLVARVSSTSKADIYEVPVDKLQIIGRVRGLLKNV